MLLDIADLGVLKSTPGSIALFRFIGSGIWVDQFFYHAVWLHLHVCFLCYLRPFQSLFATERVELFG